MGSKLDKRVAKTRIDTMQRHVLICTDGDCGGSSTAKQLRKAIARLGLRATVSVAKVDCLGICTKGTIAVVYPEGTWYAGLDERSVERLATAHLRDGEVVTDMVFHRNPLDASCLTDRLTSKAG